jgi:hypothetical protein
MARNTQRNGSRQCEVDNCRTPSPPGATPLDIGSERWRCS